MCHNVNAILDKSMIITIPFKHKIRNSSNSEINHFGNHFQTFLFRKRDTFAPYEEN